MPYPIDIIGAACLIAGLSIVIYAMFYNPAPATSQPRCSEKHAKIAAPQIISAAINKTFNKRRTRSPPRASAAYAEVGWVNENTGSNSMGDKA